MYIPPSDSGQGYSGLWLPRDLGQSLIIDPNNINNDISNIPADGAAVSAAADLGGSGSNFTQGTGANQAIYKRNIINGNNVLRFSSGQFYVSTTSPNYPAQGNLTIVAVLSYGSVGAAANRVISKNAPGGYLMGQRSGNNSFALRDVGEINGNTSAISLNTFLIQSVVFTNGTGIDFYKNRALNQSIAYTQNSVASTADLFLGQLGVNAEFYNGDLGFLLCIPRALAAYELNQLFFYLGNRFNL